MPKLSFNPDDYKPPFLLQNGHLATIYPYLFRSTTDPGYVRQRWETPDEDFVDLDFILRGSGRIVVLNHGLEGSSQSQYIKGMANHFSAKGYDVCAINQRSCSGQLNRTFGFYHSGYTYDLNFICSKLANQYEEIILIGYSLGGNQILKYLGQGEYQIPEQVKCALTFSVPIDLHGSSVALTKWQNKLYTKNFLKTLSQKVTNKSQIYPNKVDLSNIPRMRELMDFDEYYTSAFHNFTNAMDYYKQSSSKQFLGNIQIPTLLINAENDPFLSETCFPEKISDQSEYFYFIKTKFGGHAGFTGGKGQPYWTETVAGLWIDRWLLNY